MTFKEPLGGVCLWSGCVATYNYDGANEHWELYPALVRHMAGEEALIEGPGLFTL